MYQFNDIFIKGNLIGYGATHYRVALSNIENAIWKILPEDYSVEFELPNAEGDYVVYFQLKNPYNESEIYQETFRYTLIPINENPSAPTNVSITTVTETGFTVTWDASTDNSGVDHYEVRVNNVNKQNTSNLTATITGLTTNTTYTIIIRVYDIDGNYTDSESVQVTTGQAAPTIASSVKIVQVFSPTSIIDNNQTNIEVSHCFITLYNSSNSNLSLNNCRLYWKNADQTNWIKTVLSGTIQAGKYFLIRGISPTGIVDLSKIIVNWTVAVPDLDLSLDWTQATGDKTTWALTHNILFLASKSGSVLLTDRDIDPTTIAVNPVSTMTGYVDMVGVQADEFVATAYEGTVIGGNSKRIMWNRKKVSNVFKDTNNNAADFELLNFGLITDSVALTAEIKSSRNG